MPWTTGLAFGQIAHSRATAFRRFGRVRHPDDGHGYWRDIPTTLLRTYYQRRRLPRLHVWNVGLGRNARCRTAVGQHPTAFL